LFVAVDEHGKEDSMSFVDSVINNITESS